MANQINVNSSVVKTILSDTFDFSREGVRGEFVHRVKKMDQNTRQDLFVQLNIALRYTEELKNNNVKARFYDGALYSQITEDGDLPVPKIGPLTSLLRGIANFLGLRISSETIANKVIELRQQLQAANIQFDEHSVSIVGQNSDQQIQKLEMLTGNQGIPQVLQSLKDLKAKFEKVVTQEWSSSYAEVLVYNESVKAAADAITANPDLPDDIKELAQNAIAILPNYVDAKTAILAQEDVGVKTTLEANQEIANLLTQQLISAENKKIIPKEKIAELKAEIQRIQTSAGKEGAAIRKVEEDLLKTPPLLALEKAIVEIREKKIYCDYQLQALNRQNSRVEKNRQKTEHAKAEKEKTENLTALHSRKTGLSVRIASLDTANIFIQKLNESAVRGEAAFKSQVESIYRSLLLNLDKTQDLEDFQKAVRTIKNTVNFETAKTLVNEVKAAVEGVRKTASEALEQAKEKIKDINQNQQGLLVFAEVQVPLLSAALQQQPGFQLPVVVIQPAVAPAAVAPQPQMSPIQALNANPTLAGLIYYHMYDILKYAIGQKEHRDIGSVGGDYGEKVFKGDQTQPHYPKQFSEVELDGIRREALRRVGINVTV